MLAVRVQPHVLRSTQRLLSSNALRDEDYLEKSVLRSDIFQASLPRLKIPDLPKSCDRYLASQKAILDDSELAKTASIVAEFSANEGQRLQSLLVAKDKENAHTSYIRDYWFDMYLEDRRPVVLTHQPVLNMKPSENGPKYQHPVARATNIILTCAKMRNSLRENVLSPEVYHLNPKKSNTARFRNFVRILPASIASYGAYMFKAFPLDMSQHKNLFNSTRIPNPQKDVLKISENANHVAVIRNGHIYHFDVTEASGKLLPAEQILANVNFIYNLPEGATTVDKMAPGIGCITAMNRDQAYETRKRLIELGNQRNLDIVDSAMFVLCLDDVSHEEPKLIIKNTLAGPCTNRWFDKSFSIIIDRAGQCALTFEHSWGDGVAVLRLFNEIYKHTEESPAVSWCEGQEGSSNLPKDTVSRLEWMLDDDMRKRVLPAAVAAYERELERVELNACLVRDVVTKSLCKSAQVSPDAVMQLSFQLAHDKVHGRPAPTYESCSTMAFKHGRTETLRSATWETRAFVEAARGGPASSPADLKALLAACSAKHNQLTKEAAMGQGWDRHLFALRKMAEAESMKTPQLFADAAFQRANEIVLSTSTLSSNAYQAGGFAAPLRDGYGVGYSIQDDYAGLVLTTWTDSGYTKNGQFCDAFEQSLKEIAKIMSLKS